MKSGRCVTRPADVFDSGWAAHVRGGLARVCGAALAVIAVFGVGGASAQVIHGQVFKVLNDNNIASVQKKGPGFQLLEPLAGRVAIDFPGFTPDDGVLIATPSTDGESAFGSSQFDPFVTVTVPVQIASETTGEPEYFLRWFEAPLELDETQTIPVSRFAGAAVAYFPFADGWTAGRAVASAGEDPRIVEIIQGKPAPGSTTDRVELFQPETPTDVLIIPPVLVVTDEFFGLDDTWRAGVWDFGESIDARVNGYDIDLGVDEEGEPITLFIPPEPIAAVERGHYSLLFRDSVSGSLNGEIDASRDGILLAVSNVNEPVFALVAQDPLNPEPGMYRAQVPLGPPLESFTASLGATVTLRENFSDASDGAFFDQDNLQGSFSFVFVPLGTPGLTMGSFTATAYPLISQGVWEVAEVEAFIPEPDPDPEEGSEPQFTPEMGEVSFRTYALMIPGESPDTGTLIVQAPNGDSDNLDNIVAWDPIGQCWLVTTRDIEPFEEPDSFAMTDDAIDGSVLAASFIFIPRDVNVTGPGQPPQNYRFLIGQPATGVFDVVVASPPEDEDSEPESQATRVGGSGLGVSGDRFNDFSLHAFTRRLRLSFSECLMVTPRGGFTDNTPDGGKAGFPIASTSSNLARLWRANAVELEDGFAADFAAVLFTTLQSYALPEDNPDPSLPPQRRPYYFLVDERPNNQSGSSQPIVVGLTSASGFTQNVVNPLLLGIDSLPFLDTANTSGVLMVNSADASNRFATVSPGASGEQWDVFMYNGSDDNIGNFVAGSLATSSVELNAVYLPYSIPGIIAGRVDLTGGSPAVIDGSGNFQVLPGPFGSVIIRSADADLRNGTLLLNASGESGPIAMSYDVNQDGDILVFGWDLSISNGEDQEAGGPALPAGFSFAFLGTGLQSICEPEAIDDLLVDVSNGVIDFGEFISLLAVVDEGCGLPQ